MTSVLIVQRILPPYRLPFFHRLAASDEIDLTLAYGAAARGSALRSLEAPEGLHVERLDNLHLAGGRLVIQRGLGEILRSCRPELVIAEFNPRIVSNVAAMATARRLGCPFAWWGQGLGPRSSGFARRVRLQLAERADALILYGRRDAGWFAERGVDEERIFVAGNAIETAEIDRLVEDRPGRERTDVLYVGRLIPEKKVDLLVRGFASAAPTLPPECRLIVVGEGPERERIAALAAELGVSGRVVLEGAIYDESELSRRFNAARVSVSTGGVGLAAVHSLAYGVPMIVARGEPHGPEVEALVHGENALFVEPDDPAALGRALRRLEEETGLWKRLAGGARSSLDDRFTLEGMVRTFERAARFVSTGA